MKGLNRHFSHIYVERSAAELPATREILAKFPRAERVVIEDYKQFFNRPGQNWRAQKQSMKLVLARKKRDFLYPGSSVAPDFGHEHFYYNTLAINCVYDCHYCYLQGMYPSSNLVFFVNLEDFFSETETFLRSHSGMYLCLSYDTDLLALEHLYPYCRRWIEFCRDHPELVVEIRTKSANFAAIRDLEALPNVVLAWTVSPSPVIDQLESKTPPLASRLRAASEAAEAGWPLRLCFDPVLAVPDWKRTYREFVSEVFDAIPAHKVQEISVGTFRMNKEYFRRLRRNRLDSPLLGHQLVKTGGHVAYEAETARALVEHVSSLVAERVEREKVHTVQVLNG